MKLSQENQEWLGDVSRHWADTGGTKFVVDDSDVEAKLLKMEQQIKQLECNYFEVEKERLKLKMVLKNLQKGE